MTTDYLRFAGTEVVNHERLAAYIANGIRPAGGTTFDIPFCDGLSSVLYPSAGDFTTPLGDEPPWYDANDPATWDFAGVLALEVTGLNDTTRTVDMVPTIKGNGLAGRAVRGPQTVGVTAVLIGRTSEGVQAGLAWLRRVLHGACDADEQPCGQSGTLEAFTVCPGPIIGGVDLDAPQTSTQDDPNSGGDPGLWLVLNGEFSADADPGTYLIPFEEFDIVDGGDTDPEPDEYDGGGTTAEVDILDAEGMGTPVQATLGGEPETCTDGPVTIRWTLRVDEEVGQEVTLALLDDANVPYLLGPTFVLTDTDAAYEWELPLGVPTTYWRPAIITSTPVVVTSVELDTYASINADDCIAPYRRFFPVTATTSGPLQVDALDVDCAELITVEWVWTSGSPYRYGVKDPILLGLGWGEEPSLAAPGVSYDVGDPPTLVDATPWNCTPPAPAASCAIDPAAPAIGVPPAYPVITDTTRPSITTQDVRDYWALIGPELVPSNEGVLTIDLTAGSEPVVGARVRVWDTADALGVVPDLCDFAYEFLIDYIPANGVMTIDGAAGTITTLCDGNIVSQDSAAGVRGAFGGPIEDPVVRCDRRYLVRVQWLDTYPRTAAPYYTLGDTEGSLTMDLYLTPREG